MSRRSRIFEKYSSTQATNAVVFAGLVFGFLRLVGVEGVEEKEIEAFFVALFTFGGIAFQWFNRYKQGDLTLLGVRK